MVNAYTVPSNLRIEKVAKQLEERRIITPPEWEGYVKTGFFKENMPKNPKWYYIRSASVLRKLYVNVFPIGVKKLRKLYGSSKNRGSAPNRASMASGAILRNIVQQFEKNGLIHKVENGRKMTPKGIAFLDAISKEIKGEISDLERYI